MARNRMFDESVIVVGLGRFGQACALELASLGHKVTVVEKDGEVAESFVGRFDRIVHADASHPNVVDAAKASGIKIAVVAIGSSIEASVLAAANLVDAGVESIWAKALTPEHARILSRIGVHHVISPEADSGRRVAHLVNGRMLDFIEFEDGFGIVRMKPPAEAIGFTLGQSQLRSKYGVTIVGVKAPGEDFTYAVPETKISAHHELIVSGPTQLIERLAARP